MNGFITYLSMLRVRYGHCQYNSTEFFLRREYSCICQNSSDSVPTSYLVCITMASILNSKSRDLKHGGTFSNHCEDLSIKSIARLKDQGKRLVYKMFINESICKDCSIAY